MRLACGCQRHPPVSISTGARCPSNIGRGPASIAGWGRQGMLTSPELVWLLAAVAKGDEAAFERLYQATRAKLYGVVLRILRRADLAGAVMQETYLEIWSSAGQFDPASASPITWMLAIARNRAIDLVRGKSATPMEEEPEAMPGCGRHSGSPRRARDERRAQAPALLHGPSRPGAPAPGVARLLRRLEPGGIGHRVRPTRQYHQDLAAASPVRHSGGLGIHEPRRVPKAAPGRCRTTGP